MKTIEVRPTYLDLSQETQNPSLYTWRRNVPSGDENPEIVLALALKGKGEQIHIVKHGRPIALDYLRIYNFADIKVNDQLRPLLDQVTSNPVFGLFMKAFEGNPESREEVEELTAILAGKLPEGVYVEDVEALYLLKRDNYWQWRLCVNGGPNVYAFDFHERSLEKTRQEPRFDEWDKGRDHFKEVVLIGRLLVRDSDRFGLNVMVSSILERNGVEH